MNERGVELSSSSERVCGLKLASDVNATRVFAPSRLSANRPPGRHRLQQVIIIHNLFACEPEHVQARVGRGNGPGVELDVHAPERAMTESRGHNVFLTRLMTSHIVHKQKGSDLATWKVHDAKARFSEFLDTTIKKGPQVVTRRGEEAAVLVPIEEWRRLQRAARPGLKALLLGPGPCFDGLRPARRTLRRRAPVRLK
jgi:antitoxin Phd